MKGSVWKGALLALITLLVLTQGRAAALSQREAEETARLLAALLDAGRLVIDRNQSLIDDQHRGDKGFTPKIFEKQLNEEFLARTGIDLARLQEAHVPSPARGLLAALVQASKDVVGDAQLVINQRGIGYKNFIPATFGSQAAARFSSKSQVRLKQTALQPRNEKNQPDRYETAVLQRLAAQSDRSAPLSEITDEGKKLLVLTPIYYTRDCLKCHGGPAGELDISGYPKEGAKEGDLAGAVSVSVPLGER